MRHEDGENTDHDLDADGDRYQADDNGIVPGMRTPELEWCLGTITYVI